MRKIGLLTLAGLFGTLSLAPISAQTPQDVPQSHWAYEAINDLASKGLVEGYPPKGDFLGKRTITRYEMAVIIQRILKYLEANKPTTNTEKPNENLPKGVTKAEVDEVRKLVEDFKVELTVIGTDMQKVKDLIGELKAMVEGMKADVEQNKTDIAELKKDYADFRTQFEELIKPGEGTITALRTEFELMKLYNNGRKLSGYIQARYEGFEPGNQRLFSPASGGTGQNPTNGGPSINGPKFGGLVRRARLKVGGQLTTRTDWALQFDAASTGAVAVKDAFINIADLPLPNFTLTAGLFAQPFGIEMPATSNTRETPERALAFSDSTAASIVFKSSVNATGGIITAGSALPLFNGQDRDTGVLATYHSPNIINPLTKISFGVF